MALKDHIIRNKNFLKDNFMLFIGVFLLNVLGYFFHFYVGRKLGPSDYGVFGSLLSLIYIIAMPLNAIQTSITKFVSSFKVKNEHEKISYLLVQSLKKITIIGIGIFILFLALSPFIAKFLKINSLTPLFVLSIFLFFSLLIPIVRGVLQGLQRFKLLSVSYILEGVFKLGTGVLLIIAGFGVSGAIGGFSLSYLFAFIFTFYFLIKYLKGKKEKFNSKEIYKYSFPVLIILLSLTGIYTIDLILVKHFLDSISAGYYAALSLLGKVMFFGTLSISMVMFSKSSESFLTDKNHKKILYKSLILVSLFSLGVTLFYFLFPVFTINLLFGAEYYAISGLLGWFGVFMGIFSLVYVIAFYNASINRISFVYILLAFNLIEAVLITLFHENLSQIVFILLGLVSILFISLLFYTFNNEKFINSNTRIQ